MQIGKAWQRIIREKKTNDYDFGMFGKPNTDISNAVCKPVSFEDAKKIILEYEWLGTMGTTQRHYGIFYDGHCAGVVCFGYFQAMQGYATYVGEKYEKTGVQLSRGACVSWAHEHSGSKLIAYGLNEEKKLGAKYCIAFSDPEAGEIGTLYQATNWYYLGSKKDTHWDMYYKTGKLFMNDRDIFKKFGFRGKAKQEEYIRDKPELELRLRKPKARYIKLLGNKKENKEMMIFLGDKILPYPKRAEEVSREIRADSIGEGKVQFLNSAPLTERAASMPQESVPKKNNIETCNTSCNISMAGAKTAPQIAEAATSPC